MQKRQLSVGDSAMLSTLAAAIPFVCWTECKKHQHYCILANPGSGRRQQRSAKRSSDSLEQHHRLCHFSQHIFLSFQFKMMILCAGSQNQFHHCLLARSQHNSAQRSSNSLEQVVRVTNTIFFWPILVRTGSGIDLRSAAATAWSGIRGFIGLILALMVSVDADIQDEPYKLLCLFFMATTACLTIIVQGGFFELVLWVSCKANEMCCLNNFVSRSDSELWLGCNCVATRLLSSVLRFFLMASSACLICVT